MKLKVKRTGSRRMLEGYVKDNYDAWFHTRSSGLEKSTHPLVFTSESSIRASGNLPWLARQDE